MSVVADPSLMPGEQPHILLVDDDNRLRSVLRRYLQKSGFQISEASNAAEARNQLGLFAFDLIILDVMMPNETGIEFLSDLRQSSRVPVMMLTAMADGGDRILGLELGADDYLAKPFEPRELVLRLKNILARAPVPVAPPSSKELPLGSCRLDLARGELKRGDEVIHLTTGEAALLMALAANPGEAVSREELSAHSQFEGSERAVDVHVTRLRRKIELDPKFPRYLQTVRGTGYVLKPD